MFKKLIYMISFVLVLGLVVTGIAKAADPDIIGWWKLDEGSGDTAIDSSGNGFDITLQNSMWEDGLFGGAVHFRGVGYGSIGSFNYSDNAITVCAFVWHDAFRSGQVERYVTMAPEVAVIRKETDGRLHFYIKTDDNLRHLWVSDVLTESRWYHVAGTWDGLTQRLYIDGVEIASQTPGGVLGDTSSVTVSSGDEPLNGMLDEIRIYSRALMEQEIKGVMLGGGAEYPFASTPNPEDGALHEDTWASLSWRAGDFAVSHDVYFGDNFDDVDAGAESVFRGNQTATFYVAGFPGFAYPDGLIPGTTYYWRIDEVNDLDPNSPWRGDVWSFSIPPKTAYAPDPADGAELVEPDADLSWTAGFGSKLHTVYFGENFDDVNNAAGGLPQGVTTYTPGTLKMAKTYYWRVDEFDIIDTYKGDVWSFTTEGAVGNPDPANGTVDVKQTQFITWSPSVFAASHELYFGTDKDAVKNADAGSPEYKGTRDLGAESYDPGKLELDATYYWRIDEVNDANPDSPWTGILWSFTTAGFLVVDDFEDYDSGDNQIWYTWKDGLGYG
ncbi:MAG TPA: LamG domain-containing protein, partial [Sedimentisphaerales bacterium]|nr:LamG domain-containing protein [Sedimentisphaerales bacterium]